METYFKCCLARLRNEDLKKAPPVLPYKRDVSITLPWCSWKTKPKTITVQKENSRRLARSPHEPSQNDVWATSAVIPYWRRATTRTTRGNFVSTNQKHYLDLGSDASSAWNFCARYSDVVLRGFKWRPRETSAVFSGKKRQCHVRIVLLFGLQLVKTSRCPFKMGHPSN